MAGRKDPTGLTGHLLVNGMKQPSNFRHMAGYVVQVRDWSVMAMSCSIVLSVLPY